MSKLDECQLKHSSIDLGIYILNQEVSEQIPHPPYVVELEKKEKKKV